MTIEERELIILKFKEWFRETLVGRHLINTQKLIDINQFQINPFLLFYLANYLEGNSDSETLAKILVYPRVLGTSITTSFGQNMQRFISQTLIASAYGSTTSGIDIEFIDQIDGRKKYCQLKSGPNALNNDDVTTIDNHFKSARNLGKTNGVSLQYGDLIFCLLYGERKEVNGFISALEKKDVVVFVGKEFWYRFTGDEDFYKNLIKAAGEVAKEVNMKEIVNDVIKELSSKIDAHFEEMFG